MSQLSPSPTIDQRVISLLAHLLGTFTWLIGALIIWLIHKDEPDKWFVTDQAKEAMNFQLTLVLPMAGAFVLSILLGPLPMSAVHLFNLVFCIVAAVKANKGVVYRYPWTIRLIR